MSLKIIDYDGTVTAPGGDYPDGNIKNDPGGTRINVKSNGDIQQFFQRIMRLAGSTPNSLPDNVTNGYQLVDAFMNISNAFWEVTSFPDVNLGTATFEKNKLLFTVAPTSPANILLLDHTGGFPGNELFIRAGCTAGDVLGIFTAGTLEVLTGLDSMTMKNDGSMLIHIKMVTNDAINPTYIAWVYNDANVAGGWRDLPGQPGGQWGPFTTNKPQCSFSDGTVRCRGLYIATGGSLSSVLDTLPSGCIPPRSVTFPVTVIDVGGAVHNANVVVTGYLEVGTPGTLALIDFGALAYTTGWRVLISPVRFETGA